MQTIKRTQKRPAVSFVLVACLSLSNVFAWLHSAQAFNAESIKRERRPRYDGELKKNRALAESRLIGKGLIKGPEDIAIDKDGVIFAGSWHDGKVYRIELLPDGKEIISTFATTGGGNLGLMFDHHGNLIVCNSPGGLLSISPNGAITTLAADADGYKINFPDDLDIDSSGKIYFSNASYKYDGHEGRPPMDMDILETRANGSLMMYDPVTKKASVLIKNLYFANGVVLSQNEDYLLISETTISQIRRYWLKGPKKTTSEVFMDNLIGYPDGLSRDGEGGYWVAFASVRSRYMDIMEYASPLRNLASYGPIWLWERKPRYGMIMHISDSGKILGSLHDPTKKVFNVTNIVPWKNYLYLGTLEGNAIARYSYKDMSLKTVSPETVSPDTVSPGRQEPEKKTDYPVPESISAAPGSVLVMTLIGRGVQIYEYKQVSADPERFEWSLKAPRANLYQDDNLNEKVGKHYAGPTWELESGDKITAKLKAKADAPGKDAIPWLLLDVVTASGEKFSRVTTVQRINTTGGKPPVDSPGAASNGMEREVPYTALYTFYAPISHN